MISTPFVPVPPVKYGGTELIVSLLVQGLRARGHQVTLYATGDSSGASNAEATTKWMYRTPVWPPNAWAELNQASFAMCDVIADGGFDVVHAHLPAAVPFARMVGTPVVYTMHHSRDEELCDLYRPHQRPNLNMVAISERQRELHLDVCESRVIHHGLDAGAFSLGSGTGGYVAFLGRFAREKGPHAAIDAARRAGVPIRLAGRPHFPKDESYFTTEVRPRLDKQGVSWDGEAGHEPKVRLLGGALATLFPISWEEPFGLVMVESMLCGTPVIAFPGGAAAELVEEGVTGFVVRDVAAMARVILGLQRGEIAFDRVRCRERAARRFGVDRMVAEYEQLYGEAAGLTRPAAVSSALL